MTREPSSAATIAVRLARAYPSLSVYSACVLADDLCRIERAQRRHAERCCSGADGGYVRFSHRAKSGPAAGPDVLVHDPDAEQQAEWRINMMLKKWHCVAIDLAGLDIAIGRDLPVVELAYDPRGYVLKLRLPGDAEAVGMTKQKKPWIHETGERHFVCGSRKVVPYGPDRAKPLWAVVCATCDRFKRGFADRDLATSYCVQTSAKPCGSRDCNHA